MAVSLTVYTASSTFVGKSVMQDMEPPTETSRNNREEEKKHFHMVALIRKQISQMSRCERDCHTSFPTFGCFRIS